MEHNSTQIIKIPVDFVILEGLLDIPDNVKGIILFAHGSGSSRFSPRNNFVAKELQKAGFATLLFDLLTNEEDTNYKMRFNIDLLSERLIEVTQWMINQSKDKNLKIGYFGASTGAAAALKAAAKFKDAISAIVCRGGRPDLAEPDLDKVLSPTLLIVGGNDENVIDLNIKSQKKLIAKNELVIVPGATHLFEEPGTLEEVAHLAVNWFKKHLIS